MNFSTANAAAPQENTGSRYLSVGLNDGVVVTDILPGVSTNKGTPFLGVTVSKGDASTQEIAFYMSEAAAPYSLRNVRHILVDGLGVDGAVVDAIQADTLDDYAKKLTAILPKDKTFRLKFAGEEYQKTDGSIGTRRVIGYMPFAEPAGGTTLKFNEAKEVKKMPVPDAGTPVTSKQDLDGLPF